MINLSKPIILIGFKHVGKSAVGQALAKALQVEFSDLDSRLEARYHVSTGEMLNCRAILKKHGLNHFRDLESSVLNDVMREKPCVLGVGGGTPLTLENQRLISQGMVIQIKARKGLVFERIMISGRPAFFPEGEDAYEAFSRIWEERAPVYEKLADIEIENSGSIQECVAQILTVMHEVKRA